MKEVLRLEMEIKSYDDGANIKFRCGINETIEEILNNEESEKISDLIEEINQVIVSAMKRDIVEKAITETVEDLISRKPEEIYEKLSDEDKKTADKFEEELDKCKTFEEAILLALKYAKDVIK